MQHSSRYQDIKRAHSYPYVYALPQISVPPHHVACLGGISQGAMKPSMKKKYIIHIVRSCTHAINVCELHGIIQSFLMMGNLVNIWKSDVTMIPAVLWVGLLAKCALKISVTLTES